MNIRSGSEIWAIEMIESRGLPPRAKQEVGGPERLTLDQQVKAG